MTQHSARRGYVLLMTLGLIGLAGIALAGVSRKSLTLALDARSAAEDLQRRWGEISCRRMLLERAEEIIAAQVIDGEASSPPWPKPSQLAATFLLGEQQFDIALADENAKVSINALQAKAPQKIVNTVRQLNHAQQNQGLQIQLRPQRVAAKSQPRFDSWGQVFNLSRSGPAIEVAMLLEAVGSGLTCWGDGRLNVRRASETALRTTGRLVLSNKQLADLIKARNDWTGNSVDDLLAQLDLRRGKLLEVRRLLSDESDCYSLWIHAHSPHRSWSTLLVRGGNRGGPDVQSFVW